MGFLSTAAVAPDMEFVPKQALTQVLELHLGPAARHVMTMQQLMALEQSMQYTAVAAAAPSTPAGFLWLAMR